MENQEIEYKTERIDHLGIVAGICKQINLIEIVNKLMISPSGRKVSSGEAVQAMVLNALGFTGRALYLMPEYMRNKPVDLLIGEGLEADDFNDDTLGRALDEVQQAGVTEVFAEVASKAVEVFEVESEYVHLDTSTMSLHGKYDSEEAKRSVEKMEAVEIRHGYSKEQRPELKQVVTTLITSQASALPLWLEVLDGNSSDKSSFPKTIKAYCRQLEEGEEAPWFVMDSAGYKKENLKEWGKVGWVTRVPETVGEAKAVLQAIEKEAMEEVGNGYRISPLGNTYGDVRQRLADRLFTASLRAREQKSRKARRSGRGVCSKRVAGPSKLNLFLCC